MSAERSSPARASARVFEVSDVTVEILTESQEQADLVDQAVLAGTPGTSTADIHVEWTEAERAPPEGEPSHLDEGVRTWFRPGGACIAFGEVTCEVAGTDVSLHGSADDLRTFRWVFEEAMAYALANLDRYMLHCGAVATPAGSWLVIGPSGSGKSTVCWVASQSGLEVLGDDYVVVSRAGSELRCSGYPKRLAVPDEIVGSPPAGAVLVEQQARTRWLMPPALTSRAVRPLVGILRPQRAEGPPAIVDARDALLQVLDAHPPAQSPGYLQSFFPAAAAIARLPDRRLTMPADPEARVSQLAGALGALDGA